MLEALSTSGLINAIIAIGFGLLLITKNWHVKRNQIFFLMTLALTIWGVAYWQWLAATNESDALFWTRLLSLGSIFIPVFFYHWVIEIFKKRGAFKILLVIAYFIGITVALFSFSDLVVASVTPKLFFPYWPNPGILYSIYLFTIYILLTTISTWILFAEYFKAPADSNEHGQLVYMLLGTIIGFSGGLTNFPLWYDIMIPPYGTFLAAVFPFFLGYATLRYPVFNTVFNLKSITTEIMVFLVMIALVIQVVLAESFFFQVLQSVILVIFAGFSYLLVKSVYREVEQRQEIARLAENLEKANERLKELDRMKSQFLSIASHDLRAPLTAIRNFMSLLLDGTYGKLPPAAEEGTQHVFERSTEMAEMVENYLNVSRIEQGRMKYDFAEMNFKDTVSEAVLAFKPLAKERKLELLYTESKDTFKLKGDEPKLREVVENLINNALLYTVKGSITISLERVGERATLIVSDTGVGMSQKTIGKLFKLFSQGDDSRKVNPKSTGVGLYITKAHVEAHKGKIWAESDGEGKGSRFIVELPLIS